MHSFRRVQVLRSAIHGWCPVPRLGTRLRGYARSIDRARIDHIHEQLAAIRRKGIKAFGSGAHEFKLHPPIPAQQLKAFEASHEVRLPEAYRAFLLHVGNGGAGQGYGLALLEQADMGGILKNPSPLHPDMPRELREGGGMSYSHSISDAARSALRWLWVARLPGALLTRLKKGLGKD